MLRRRFGRQDLIAEDGDGPDALMGDAGNDAIFGNGGNDMVTAGSNLLDDGLAGTTVKSITAEDDWETPVSATDTDVGEADLDQGDAGRFVDNAHLDT